MDMEMNDFVVRHDERGREILSDMPSYFNVPVQKRISTLDFHRQRLLEQREMMRRMIEDMQAEAESETFEEANDFRCDEDPLDDEASFSDFELADDGVDGLEALALEEYRRIYQQQTLTATNNATPSEGVKA